MPLMRRAMATWVLAALAIFSRGATHRGADRRCRANPFTSPGRRATDHDRRPSRRRWLAQRRASRALVRNATPATTSSRRSTSVGYLAYDDRFFYAAFEFDDPNPSSIRAPLGDHDHVQRLHRLRRRDPRHAQRRPLGRAAARDATRHSVRRGSPTTRSGEDSSPDFFWDSAARITETRLDARDARAVLVAALSQRRPADLGHPAVPQLPARFPLSDSSRRSCRAAATASSAAPTRCVGLEQPARRAATSSPRRMSTASDAAAPAAASARRSRRRPVKPRGRRST